MYNRYVEEPLEDTLPPEFEKWNKEGRILRDDHFAESALQQAGEPIDQTLELEEIIQAVYQLYRITEKQLIAMGKERKPSEARSVIALIVRGSENPTLEVWEERCGRDGVTLSNAIRILPEHAKTGKDLVNKMKEIEEKRLISFGSIPRNRSGYRCCVEKKIIRQNTPLERSESRTSTRELDPG